MDKFSKYFEAAIPQLRKRLKNEFKKSQTQLGYRSVWEHFEDVINPIMITFLQQPPLNIPARDIEVASSKSTYPDIKIKFEENSYAIDVKSGDDGKKDPWYDMGRLDTYEKNHLNKYAGEYCVTVRWKNKIAPHVIDIYIEPSHKSVGYNAMYKGIAYQPYSGKIRPKSWSDFESGYSHWKTIDDFKIGLRAAQKYRRIFYIDEWYKEMNEAQRQQVKKIISLRDAGKPIDLLKEMEEAHE